MTPTARSLKKLREDGYLAAVVEKWNPHAKIRQDLFGFIDIVAIKDDQTWAIQATGRSNVSARIKKILENENLARVVDAGWIIVVHGWGKMASGRWELREERMS